MIALYARTSTNLQATGLEAQLRALKEYCAKNNLGEYRIYSDEGVSGTKSSRPALDKLMVDMKEGRISKVVTYSLSRLSRSTTHLLNVLEIFKTLKVGFVSLSESIDIATSTGMLIITVLGAVAQLEREITAERVRNGLANARAKGKRLGRPSTVNRDLVKALVLQGMTYRQIAKLTRASHWVIREVVKQVRSATEVSDRKALVG